MKRVFSAAAIGIALMTSALARDLQEDERRMISDSVTGNLKDPGSAQIRFTDFNETNVYCGMMNAKNSYGGYIGFRPFSSIVKLGPQKQILSVSASMYGDSPALQTAVVNFCGDNGYQAR